MNYQSTYRLFVFAVLFITVCHAASVQSASRFGQQADPVGVVITLHPSGFLPPQMQVANGRYLLLVLNRSGIRDLEFDLDRETGGRLHMVRDGRTDASGANPVEYIFWNDKRAARRDPDGSVHYYFADHLGSASVVTTESGGDPRDESDFYPYGREIPVADGDSNHYKFTGKERDVETGLDYFGARYYGSTLGRWLSPDEFSGGPVEAFSPVDPSPPGPLPYADITNPQSLNKYSYTYNNPLRYTDPDGHCVLAGVDTLVCYAAVTATVAVAAAVLASPQGQQSIRDGLNALGSMASSISAGISNLSKAIPNPWGSKGAPDHQDKVKEEAEKARAEAQAGETVLVGQKVQGIDSNRHPDVQVVGADGKTKTVTEVERKPESKRHKERSKEYEQNKIPQKTVPLKNKKAPRPEQEAN